MQLQSQLRWVSQVTVYSLPHFLSPVALTEKKKQRNKSGKKERKKEKMATKWQMPTYQIKLEYSARGQIEVLWKQLIKKQQQQRIKENLQ